MLKALTIAGVGASQRLYSRNTITARDPANRCRQPALRHLAASQQQAKPFWGIEGTLYADDGQSFVTVSVMEESHALASSVHCGV
jgi:hypothetical protein